MIPKVGFVVLSWNGAKLLKNCLDALYEQSEKSFHVVVVDNGSNDNTNDVVKAHRLVSQLTYFRNEKNLGYAKANNQAIKLLLKTHPKLQYVVLLNNDAELSPDWLSTMLEYMNTHKDVGLAQGSNYSTDTMDTYDSTGIYLEEGFIPRQRASGKTTEALEITSVGPNAAAVILRRKLIDDISYKGDLLDSRFFAYVEDVDMLLRAFSRGWKHAFVAEATAIHIGSVTGERVSTKKMYWGTRNLIWLLVKNVPIVILRKKLKKIAISHLANMQFLYKTNKTLFWAYLHGFTAGILLSPIMYQKRRYIGKHRLVQKESYLQILTPSAPPLTNPLKAFVRKLHG